MKGLWVRASNCHHCRNTTDSVLIQGITGDLYIGGVGEWHANEQLLQGEGGQKSLLSPNENAA